MIVRTYGFSGGLTRPTGNLGSQPSPRFVHVEACRPRRYCTFSLAVIEDGPQGLEYRALVVHQLPVGDPQHPVAGDHQLRVLDNPVLTGREFSHVTVGRSP